MPVNLSPIGGAASQFFDNNGVILSGGKIYTYVAGTTTPLATYTSSSGATPHANPIILDSAGRVPGGEIWLTSNTQYKFVIYTSLNVLIGSFDNISSANDLSLLATSAGASLIGAATGGTVEDAIWHKGRAVPIPASKAQVNWVRDDAADPLENIGGLWPADVVIDHGINKVFDSSLGEANAPVTSLFVKAQNSGSNGDVVGLMVASEASSANKTAFATNFIAYSSGGVDGYKLVGLEIDLNPEAGTTPDICGGLYINAFTMELPGPAIYVEGIFGGKWGTGLSMGNLADTGAGIAPAVGNPRMGSLVDTGTAQYQIDAIKLNNTHKIRLQGTASAHALIYVDNTNNWRFVMSSSVLVIRNNLDTVSLISFDSGGNINLESGGTVSFDGSLSTNSAIAGVETLPANPVGFLTVKIAGIACKIPYYE